MRQADRILRDREVLNKHRRRDEYYKESVDSTPNAEKDDEYAFR